MSRTVEECGPLDGFVERARVDRRASVLPLALAVSSHVAFALSVSALTVAHDVRAAAEPPVTQVVDVDMTPPPPPPEPPPPPPPEPTPTPEQAPPSPSPSPHLAPAPAVAAAVMTAQPDPNAPVDFSDTMVTGSGTTYVGGTTSTAGTSLHAVRDVGASSKPAAPAASAPPPPSGPDRSRRATRRGQGDWKCPFPSEADGVDAAVVTLRIDVGTDGSVAGPAAISVVSDPGHGFAREARRCAQDQSWEPALDHDGQPIRGSVTVNVRFER